MSASGTGPFTFGARVPLTIDPLTTASLQGVLSPLQTAFGGTLSGSATASASLLLPPGLFSGIIGRDLAAITFPPGGRLDYSSVANRLAITP